MMVMVTSLRAAGILLCFLEKVKPDLPSGDCVVDRAFSPGDGKRATIMYLCISFRDKF